LGGRSPEDRKESPDALLAALRGTRRAPRTGMKMPTAGVVSDMNEQQAREFVEMLAVPKPAVPPPCPLCGEHHPLEARCVVLSRDNRLEAAGLRE
jgi:hypothetical protein